MSIVSVAPMMNCTDKHARYFMRLLSPDVMLYTEMITAQTLAHADPHYFLHYHESEHPIALQLGGSDPMLLAKAAKLGEQFGYDEINLNAGCPSPRVSKGKFGACLMLEPACVSECISAMNEVVSLPVTIKCRIGVDQKDDYSDLQDFVEKISISGCNKFIVHARKAWLKGLSPRQNRDIPPLRYDIVYQLKQDFPHLTIVINGGIKTLDNIDMHLQKVDGVMIGREAYHNPWFLQMIQARFFANKTIADRYAAIREFLPYVQEQLNKGVRLNSITRHILGLFHGQRGANLWRRYLTEYCCKSDAGINVIEEVSRRIHDMV